ncbi:MAG TPA: TetR/AcrR family transcriptional regulator [Acidimicrobiales bacterium]|nr:TetR/AcrR family transcriptional regulator [Acidimicrobiales bacterium]
MTTTTPARRLNKSDRREQLLDVAADFLTEAGAAGLTMEGLAERAGVSKALPYSHFDNSDAVLVALYQREVARMGEGIAIALAACGPDATGEERMRAAFHAYFDVIEQRGAVLAMLLGPGSRVPTLAEDNGAARNFLAEIVAESFDVTPKQAAIIAELYQSIAAGAVASWAKGLGSRRFVEELVVRFTYAGVAAVSGE